MALKDYATKIENELYNFYPEHHGEEDKFRTIWHHDRAEVTYSPYFRRMAFKKYHIKPGPDNRTRLLHSLEVATIASLIARSFELNIELTEAIALGHDVASPPYNGEIVLDKLLRERGDKDGFDHSKLGAKILEWGSLKKRETDKPRFKTLNDYPCYHVIDDGEEKITTISNQVLDGIAKHTPPYEEHKKTKKYIKYRELPQTIEGQVVRIADNLSYLSQEVAEAISIRDWKTKEQPFLKKLRDYQSMRLFKNPNHEVDQMSEADLLKSPHPNIQKDPNFLKNIFDEKLGPRLMTMILRVKNYNSELYDKQNPESEEMLDSELSGVGKIPILKYDDELEWITDFYWDVFIKEVNDYRVAQRNKECNREKIKLFSIIG